MPWPLTSTGTCQARSPVFVSYAWITPTPFGYCAVVTTRPMFERPLAVVVTGLTQVAGGPAAVPPVATSPCFQTILFVAGLKATRREIVSAFGADDVRHWMID